MAFPEKRPLITYSDRPPLLESPRSTFARGITENDDWKIKWSYDKKKNQLIKRGVDTFTGRTYKITYELTLIK